MPASHTIIAALSFEGGVVIGSDSQVSDIPVDVKWPVTKLHSFGKHPAVVGFSGSTGAGGRVWENIEAAKIHANIFKKRVLVRNLLDRCFEPEYERIKRLVPNPSGHPFWDIALSGLAAFWAEDAPHILEYETSGDSTFHPYFHAVGSGGKTAYAIFRTLGGRDLCSVDERKATLAMLRILRTCINVEALWVSEPISFWVIANEKARLLSREEIDAQLQYVGEWEEKERREFFDS